MTTIARSVHEVYAIGDLIMGPMLAHKAEEEGIAWRSASPGMKSQVNYDAIPSVIYTHPELAAVGLTEEQVKDAGRSTASASFPSPPMAARRCLDETDGFVKIIADAKTDRVLGVHILGSAGVGPDRGGRQRG